MSGAPIRVAKMSGAGNDFVVLGPRSIALLPPHPEERAEWVRRVCRRGLSVGADGVLLVEPEAAVKPTAITVRFMNPDGSPAFCGNGTRCAARFAQLEGFANATMQLDTMVGRVPATIRGDQVSLELPTPVDKGKVELDVLGEPVAGWWIDAGSRHFVAFVADVKRAPLDMWGPVLRRHARFGDHGVNVNLVERTADDSLSVRTWERGVEGETLACGSGALATAFVASRKTSVRSFKVTPASGVPITVTFSTDPSGRATMQGDARLVFETDLTSEATCGF